MLLPDYRETKMITYQIEITFLKYIILIDQQEKVVGTIMSEWLNEEI